MAIELSSEAFAHGEEIPVRHTCDGVNLSPPLRWKSVPPGTRSLALIADDPDAPAGTWVHWVLYGLPPETRELTEGMPAEESPLAGARHGRNDFRRLGYGGPCPPPGGAHRYFFKLYALDAPVDLPPGATRGQLLEAIEGHVLEGGELMGRYGRRS